MSPALAIFVKTPGYSPIKTRLAAGCGSDFAERWHQLAAAAVASVARRFEQQCGAHAYWAVAEAAALEHGIWNGLQTLAQGEGGLGERLALVYRTLQQRHGAVLLLGADSPQLSVELLVSGVNWLQAAPERCVLAPRTDGGFWLAGGNRPLPAQVWTDVRYSLAETGEDMRRALLPYATLQELPRLRDVDSQQDLLPVLHALQALPEATDAQVELAQWMQRQGCVAVQSHRPLGSLNHPVSP